MHSYNGYWQVKRSKIANIPVYSHLSIQLKARIKALLENRAVAKSRNCDSYFFPCRIYDYRLREVGVR
mgnify:CR=1 FL=1